MHIYTLILIHLSLSNWAIWHTVINNELAHRYLHVGYLSWVIYLCSALCTLKPKKPLKKPLKPKKPTNLKKCPALREYRRLIEEKRNAFWRTKVDSERSDPHQLWRSVSSLMGRGRAVLPCRRWFKFKIKFNLQVQFQLSSLSSSSTFKFEFNFHLSRLRSRVNPSEFRNDVYY